VTARGSDRTLAALSSLLDGAHLATPGQLPDIVLAAAGELGWTAVIYLVDYEQRLLTPVPAAGMPGGEPQAVDATLAGRAFRTVEPVPVHADGLAVWVPLLDGVERLGVLKVSVPDGTKLDDPLFRDRCRLLAYLTGHLVAVKAPYGDALDRVRRRRPRTVASELLWQLLPPLTFSCEGLVLSGLLEPCYEVAADAFDYGLVDDAAHLAVLDATGHDLSGTLLTAVALAAYRSSRRQQRGLYDTARAIDEVIAAQGRHQAFVTGVLGELDLGTGRLRYLNAGHPAPLLMRRGKVVKALAQGRRILFGLGGGAAHVAEEWLEPDDWVVFYTDGVTEARDPEGHFFGLDRLTDLLEKSAAAGQPAPETLRRVIHEVLAHQHGALQDDATLLVAQWATGKEQALSSA
jgi:sigma-B regulation protein RsbU (phosphoserine phosphatase)